MATNNKSLTTYLPDRSVEWLESYCLEYKHLQNKDGNPKLGTAIADIIARLADGELTLPVKIEPISTVVDNVRYSTELETLKREVDELKKLLIEYGTNKLPDTVLDSETVDKRISEAIENRVEPKIAGIVAELKEQKLETADNFVSVRGQAVRLDEELKKLQAIAKAPSPHKPEIAGDEPEWVDVGNRRFYLMLVDNSDLLDRVTAEVDRYPKDNAKLADSLVGLGFHKKDGTALDSANMSRIRKVASQLRTTAIHTPNEP